MILIGAALALPIVLLVAFQVLTTLDAERARVRGDTLSRAEQVMVLTNARVEADFALMHVLGTSQQFRDSDWARAAERAREVAALNPHWRNVILSDLETRRQLFSLLQPGGEGAPINEVVAREAQSRGVVGGPVREGAGCPCVYLHLPLPGAGAARYVLSVAIDPEVFRSALMRYTPDGATSAIVDQSGRFIARNRDNDIRFGTLASAGVRAAIARGAREGFFEGLTVDGFETFTAFSTSPDSRWSAHIGVPSSLMDRPRVFADLTIVIGGLLSLALAAGLVAFAMRDMAQRRLAESRLAQTQKLEAIGQLTGGVAHDFNNLLTVMIGGLNMLLKRIEDPKQRQIAEHMMEAAQRGDKLTKQLLAFSRGQRMELAAVDLHQLAPGMEELLRRSISPGMALSITLHPDARWVRSDANQLELAILNLVINARDAMPDGGRIDVATQPAAQADMIELSVTDSGIGMPKDVVDRALEPFFTTKPAGKGTGLGLAQVFGAARQSGGSVEIDSAVGRGTTVRVLLPRSAPQAPAPQTAAEPTTPAPSAASGKRVLVVDDEPGVRSFMAETLREAGYVATEAEDVGVALRLLDTEPPDLLLTDYSMPGMNGLELAERARARDARLQILIVSGYADALMLEASAARPNLLRKPFDEAALLNAVRNLFAPS